jgi:seryl-tRNA(Sec) selenium transferase
MVVISGGKAIRGPQSAGLLMGKKDIISAARLHMPPRGFNIGRGMKVNKEEIVGMYVALERYLTYDHEKEWQAWEKAISQIENAVKTIDGVTTKVSVPPLGNITPTLEISWDTGKIKFTSKELQEKLRTGSPSIEVANAKENGISITVWVMKPGEEKIVARRLKQEFSL